MKETERKKWLRIATGFQTVSVPTICSLFLMVFKGWKDKNSGFWNRLAVLIVCLDVHCHFVIGASSCRPKEIYACRKWYLKIYERLVIPTFESFRRRRRWWWRDLNSEDLAKDSDQGSVTAWWVVLSPRSGISQHWICSLPSSTLKKLFCIFFRWHAKNTSTTRGWWVFTRVTRKTLFKVCRVSNHACVFINSSLNERGVRIVWRRRKIHRYNAQ